MRKKLSFALLAVAISAQIACAGQERKYWKPKATVGLTAAQTSYDNWVAGGENSLVWVLTFDNALNYTRDKHEFENKLKLAYGQTKQGGKEARKSEDKIELSSTYVYKIGIYVNPYVSMTLETQFSKGFEYKGDRRVKAKSDFVDPLHLSQSAGVGFRPFRPKDLVRIRIGVSVREDLANRYASIWTDDPKTPKIEKKKIQPGLESVTDMNITFGKDMAYSSRLKLFSAFEDIDQLDAKWENNITARVAKYINITLRVDILYDRDINPRAQWKQTLTIGLSYKLI